MIQKQEFDLAMAKYEEDATKLQAEMFEAQGAVKALMEAIFIAPDANTAKKAAKLFLDALGEAQDKNFKYGQSLGAAMENRRYSGECQALLDAAGGERALQTMIENGL